MCEVSLDRFDAMIRVDIMYDTVIHFSMSLFLDIVQLLVYISKNCFDPWGKSSHTRLESVVYVMSCFKKIIILS